MYECVILEVQNELIMHQHEVVWDSIGQPDTEMDKGTGKASISQEKKKKSFPLGYGRSLCHLGLGGNMLSS